MARNTKDPAQEWRSPSRAAPGVRQALEKLGQRIRELREEAGYTQEEAGERAGIDAKHWSDIECGRTNPTVTSLVGIARGLDVTLPDLFAA